MASYVPAAGKSTGRFLRVSRDRRCPVCGRPDWCLVAADASAAICSRVESSKPVGERGAGWLHRFDAGPWVPRPKQAVLCVERPAKTQDFAAIAAKYAAEVNADHLAGFADRLGVSVDALHRLGIGWNAGQFAWSFPMSDSEGQVLGLRLRAANGRKFSATGGREGLFIPRQLDTSERLLVCEGPTDTAALLDLGLQAVGRPSCSGGVGLLVDLVRHASPPAVLIVADGDEPGIRGAKSLAARLALLVPHLAITTPPAGIKDAREWRRQGATAHDVLNAPAITTHLQITEGR